MDIPLRFGPYGSGALTHADRFVTFGANACWFHGFDPAAFEAFARRRCCVCRVPRAPVVSELGT